MDLTRKQINVRATVISMMSNLQQINPETIRQYVGTGDLACYFLFVKVNEYCKLIRSDEEFLVDVENPLDEEAEVEL